MTTQLRNMLNNLASQDWWSRRETILRLIEHPENEYIGFLENAIRNHEDADVRNAAMEVYRALGTRALPSLSSLLRDEDAEIRLFAVNVLQQIGSGALPLLLSSIRDPDVNVRIASAEALGSAGNTGALAALKTALDDEPWVGMAAVSAIGEIGGEGALEILYDCLAGDTYREIAIATLKRCGTSASVNYLTSCFVHENLTELTLRTIISIAEREKMRPHPEYFIGLVPQLIEMFGSCDRETKQLALTALCWSEDIRGLSCLVEAARDEALQEQAIEGLLKMGKRAVCSIVDELKDSEGNHRPILAKVLSMIADGKVLLQFWEDEDPEVRVEVALGLRPHEMERAAKALHMMLSDSCEEVRMAAQKSLDDAGDAPFLPQDPADKGG